MHILRLHWGCYRCMLISCRFVCYFLYNISIFLTGMWISLTSWRTTTLGLGATRPGLWHHCTQDRLIKVSTKRYRRLIIFIQFFLTINGCRLKIVFICLYDAVKFWKLKKTNFIIIIKHIHEGCMILKFEVKYTPLYL